jgi:hypothetical protein
LQLLAGRCPGIAPRPLWRDDDPTLPLVAMEVLPGQSLRDRPLVPRESGALADTLSQLQAITPANAEFPYHSAGAAQELLARVERWLEGEDGDTVQGIQKARELARQMLAGGGRSILLAPVPSIFSRGDPNLANCLWDAESGRMRLIDFEYAGWGDLAGDLADLIEGPWARHVTDDDWLAIACALGLRDPANDPRFLAARCVCATFWVMKFSEQLARDPSATQHAIVTSQLVRARKLLQEFA